MKKIINIFLIKIVLIANLFASDNSGSVQMFISKTNGLTTIGTTEEIFVGSEKEILKMQEALSTEVANLQSKDSISSGYSTEYAVKAGLGGVAATTIAIAGASAATGKSLADGMKSGGGLIGLAVIGATVAGIAIFNGTKGMREDHKYISIFRNTVADKVGLIYVLVVSNSELTNEEVKKLTNEKIKG